MKYPKLFFPLLLSLTLLSGCSLNADAIGTKIQTVKEWVGLAKQLQVSVDTTADTHIVVVPGYGAPVKGNPGYEEYIEQVATFVEDESHGVDAVVFTGGYSSLKDTSEAESMNSYFNSVVDQALLQKRGVRIYKEECAIVSWQNIGNSNDLLQEAKIEPDRVTVFGDTNRKEKLVAFSNYVFNKDRDIPSTAQDLVNKSIYTTIDFQGYNFGGSQEDQQKRNAKFLAEAAAAYNAELGNKVLQERIDEWTTEFGYDVATNLVAKGCSEFAGFQ